jgi:hypothetical protein
VAQFETCPHVLAALLAAVREGPSETRDRARALIPDVFRLLGDDHP